MLTSQIHKNLLSLAALAAIALGVPATARATFQLALQQAGVNAGAITVVATTSDFNPVGISFSGTYGDFSVSVQGGSSTNAAALSSLLSSTTNVTNSNLLTGGTHTLSLWVTQTNYNLPVGSQLNVESGMGGSINNGTLGLTGIFQAFADTNNGAFTNSFTNGLQNASATGSTYDTGSANGVFNRGNPSYSLTSVANFTVSAGGVSNYSNHVNVTAVPTVPEPISMVAWAFGLVGLGGSSLVRRWRRSG